MSNVLTKFKELYTQKITLPDSGEIEISQINVDFQDKLLRKVKKAEGDVHAVLLYILHMSNYISDKTKKNLTYKDKLYVLQHWRNNIVDDPTDHDLNSATIENEPYKANIGTADIEIGFKLPQLKYELDLLQYLNKKKEPAETDLIFYDTFRFINYIKLGATTYNIDDLTNNDLHELFLLFDPNMLKPLSAHISTTLQDLNKMRIYEADYSNFLDV